MNLCHSLLNLFLSAFDQLMVLFPYLIAGPLVARTTPRGASPWARS